MAQAQSYNVVNNREDLTDLLTTVAPEQTPILSSAPKYRAQNATLMEWTANDLDNPTYTGTQEGQDQTTHGDKTANRVTLSNRYQEERKGYSVSNIQQMNATAGVPDEEAEAKAQSIIELKTNIESAFGSDNDLQAGSGLNNSLLRGLGAWINASTATIDASVRPPAASLGTTSTLTESGFNDVLQSVYDSAGVVQNMKLYAGSTLQRTVSEFTRAEGSTTPTPFIVNSNQSDREIVMSVQFYRGDFANVEVISDQFLGRTSGSAITTASKQRGYLISDDKVSVSVWKAPHIFEQSDEGGGPRGFACGIQTLVVKNPKGLGKFSG